MKTTVFVLLLAVALGACTPAVTPAPAVTSIPATSPSGPASWSLVAVGDSIPYNSSEDCPGCTGFVDRYAAAISKATGHPVKVQNLSQHNGLQTDDLLEELKTDTTRREALANADIIVVGIGHNDTAWGRNDDPCDGPTGDNVDWSKYNATCAAAAAEIFRPKFESVYAQVVALRAGKPTIFRTINVYNDWIGDPGNHNPNDLGPEAKYALRVVLDPWSAMICKAAQANGFTCADIYHAFNGPDGLTPSGDLLAKDYTHPSDKGNEVMARVLADLGYAPLAPAAAQPPAPTGVAMAAAPDTQQLAANLETMLQKFTEEQHFRGSVLVAQNGQVILSKGYGLADREKKIPNTAQTKFLIGTITKQFTAMAIMMLQEQGKLNVQDKICKYLTGCPEAWKPITLHQLLTQTSGIPDRTDVYFYRSITSTVPLEQMIADVKTLPLDFQPGEKFSYDDGVDYTLLGKIIEAVSGQSYGAFLQKNIFDPLQMSNTGYDPNRTDLAVGGSNGMDAAAAPQLNMWFMFSAAGLYSTVEDLYRWDQALYTDKLVPQKDLDTMFTSYVPSERDGYGFGYGWYIGLDKQRVVKTPGNIIGFDGTLRRYLHDKATIIYLTNQDDYDNKVIADSIAMKLFGFVGK